MFFSNDHKVLQNPELPSEMKIELYEKVSIVNVI